MPQERYVVKAGDNLWDITKAKLGAGSQWPRIWRYNNRRDVVAATGRGIPNPDLLHPGQVLLLPVLPSASAPAPVPAERSGQQLRRAPASPAAPLSRQLPGVTSPISFKYKLDDIKFPPIVRPGVLLEMRMTGDVLLMSKKSYPALYVTSRGEVELQVTREANAAWGKLVYDTRLIYDAPGNRLTYRSMLVAQSRTPNAPSSAVGVEIGTNSPVPKIRYEIRLPKLEGSIDGFLYVAFDVKLVVEMTPLPQGPGSGPSAQPVRSPATNWNRVIGTGLMVAGGTIIVATLVEDFFTGGWGALDDPASFAAAAALFARASALLRGGAVLFPRAAVAATAGMTITLVPAAREGSR